MTKVYGLKCRTCGDFIYSRARHDFRTCTCGNISVDGGFDYMKCSGPTGGYDSGSLQVNATKEALYNDWNKAIDKFGKIHLEDYRKKGVEIDVILS